MEDKFNKDTQKWGDQQSKKHEDLLERNEDKTNLERLPFPELVKEMAEYYKNVPLVEKMYTEEDLGTAFKNGFSISYGDQDVNSIDKKDEYFKEWFKQYKK